MPNIQLNSPQASSPNLRTKIELVVLTLLVAIIVTLGLLFRSEPLREKFVARANHIISSIQSIFAPKPTTTTADNNVTASPTPKPTIIPLPEGPQSYRFSYGSEVVGPKISRLTVNPLTPEPGTNQTITIEAGHTTPITEVVVEVITDEETKTHKLSKSDGNELQGSWTGTWNINTPYNYQYGFHLVLKSSDSTYDNTMWLRRSI
jgi:hypothetical protein